MTWKLPREFGATPFFRLNILSTRHFVNSTFHQLYISLTRHFVNLTFHQLYISLTRHFVNWTFCWLDILSTWHIFNPQWLFHIERRVKLGESHLENWHLLAWAAEFPQNFWAKKIGPCPSVRGRGRCVHWPQSLCKHWQLCFNDFRWSTRDFRPAAQASPILPIYNYYTS